MRSALVLVVVLVACEARLAPGERCTRGSECPEPLGCVLGRCRVECVSDADCASGVHCVAVAPGSGACTVESEERCTGTSCPAPLECSSDVCRAPCLTDGDCLAAERCAGAICEPRSATDAGVPDDGGFVPPTPRLCASAAGCEMGEICASDLEPSVCRTACDAHGDCPEGAACDWYVSDDDAGYAEGCSTVCVPGTSDGCPAGLTCRMATRDTTVRPGPPANVAVCWSYATGPAGGHGCPCDYLLDGRDCGAGLSCEEPPEGRMCLRICAVGSLDCGPGVECVATMRSIVIGGRQYGVCPPPATSPTCS